MQCKQLQLISLDALQPSALGDQFVLDMANEWTGRVNDLARAATR